jgi:putative tryptophan/tyrosine transport system substrate-binding protein
MTRTRELVMDRRNFQRMLAGALLSLPFAALAQQDRRIPRIGFMRGDPPPQSYIDAFEQGLRERGYIPGQSILIEYRFDHSDVAELERLGRELVGLKVDVIVAGGGLGTRGAKSATSTIPIVMTAASDPVGTGFVASLAHPGGNITGTSIVSWELFGKRIELLKQILPKLVRVAVLVNRNNPASANAWKESAAAAAAQGVILQRVEVQSPRDFETAFAAMAKGRAEALIVVQSNIFDSPPEPLVRLAADNKIPAIYGPRISADAGGLMAYGPNVRDLYGRAATFVDKILKGARPADLPVEQPVRFELVINLKTAKALGVNIPQSLLLRADEVIQ